MEADKRSDFNTAEVALVVNQTSCRYYDLSHLSPEERGGLIEALKAEGLLDEDDG